MRDRIVQAAMAQILEALYAPMFRECSYGFRPGRNTIQALRHVAHAYQAGATWLLAGDVGKCCDSWPHGVILRGWRKRIKDERFLALVRQMLKAGVREEREWVPTYSGTPQGGWVSPILSHVVLSERDGWREDHWQANPPSRTATQQHARANPTSARHKRHRVRWRAPLPGRMPMGRQPPEGLRAKITHALVARQQGPSGLPRRRISSGRFADDDVVVLCRYSLAAAQCLKHEMAPWLQEN